MAKIHPGITSLLQSESILTNTQNHTPFFSELDTCTYPLYVLCVMNVWFFCPFWRSPQTVAWPLSHVLNSTFTGLSHWAIELNTKLCLNSEVESFNSELKNINHSVGKSITFIQVMSRFPAPSFTRKKLGWLLCRTNAEKLFEQKEDNTTYS